MSFTPKAFANYFLVIRGLDPRIHPLLKKDGLPGQARQ
jgi:hypothetical protein